MKLLDVNVILAAHRSDHPQFEVARPWLDALIATGQPYAVPDLVAASFLRIATNRRIFHAPTPLPDAFAYLRALRDQPAHVAIVPGPDHAALLERVCVDYDAAGDLVPDALLATLAIEQGAELASFDRDFARFTEVRWVHPAD